MIIDGTTKTYGIIGWPVAHSLSPVFQARFIERQGLNAVYVPFAVEPERLRAALDGLWAAGVQGANVTVPHKEAVFRMVTADDDARLIGAVNTIRRRQGEPGWLATNTDWQGFRMVLDGLGIPLHGACALLFGAGGTARAVVHALARAGVARLLVCNRNRERLDALIAHAGSAYPELECIGVDWQQDAVTQACNEAALWINTTSIGLKPDESFPFQLSGVATGVDVVYRPDGDTPFRTACRDTGVRAVDGLPMLIAQGAASFAWWHGLAMPEPWPVLAWMEQRLGRTQSAAQAWRSAA